MALQSLHHGGDHDRRVAKGAEAPVPATVRPDRVTRAASTSISECGDHTSSGERGSTGGLPRPSASMGGAKRRGTRRASGRQSG